jgi:hypothetical protein
MFFNKKMALNEANDFLIERFFFEGFPAYFYDSWLSFSRILI